LFEHAPQALVTISVLSTLADIADENELRFGTRQEGVLFATRTLSYKFGLAIGSAIAGLAVTLVALPTNAKPGQVPEQILFDLNLAYVLGSLPGFLAILAFTRYRITRESHARTKAALEARREGPSDEIAPIGAWSQVPAGAVPGGTPAV
jgi:Na+/melibiose symporter-like transporter